MVYWKIDVKKLVVVVRNALYDLTETELAAVLTEAKCRGLDCKYWTQII